MTKFLFFGELTEIQNTHNCIIPLFTVMAGE